MYSRRQSLILQVLKFRYEVNVRKLLAKLRSGSPLLEAVALTPPYESVLGKKHVEEVRFL